MSILKKNTLALAIIAAAGFAASAGAYTIRTAADTTPEPIATQLGATVTMTQQINAQIELGDALIGRTTGFQARITLLDGARFNTALTSGSITLGSATVGTWNSTLAAGGLVNGTIAQFQIAPSAPGSTITAGELFSLAALNLNQVSLTGNTSIRIELIDPVTGLVIAGAVNNTTASYDQSRIIISRIDGLAFACSATANANRIDVAGNTTVPNAPRTAFVAFPWTIGGTPVAGNLASLGTVTATASAGFTLNVAGGGDSLFSTVTGPSLAGLTFFLGNAGCTTTYGTYTNNVGNTVATLNTPFATLNTNGASFIGTGGSATLCVAANGTTAITAQALAVQLGINTVAEADACNVAEIQYNGSTVNIANLPPAGNATQEGFVRIVNNSTLSGRVTIRGRDDAGVLAPSVTLTLPGRTSVIYTSAELESGTVAAVTPAKPAISGAFGDGAGRWRLNVVGEFDNMQVQAYARNVNNDALSNITDFETNTEQTNDRKNQNFD
jgi:hypothetical protein